MGLLSNLQNHNGGQPEKYPFYVILPFLERSDSVARVLLSTLCYILPSSASWCTACSAPLFPISAMFQRVWAY